MSHLKKALLKYFGYPSFKEGQLETIQSVMQGQDTLSILPTGTGKSLCYQLPSYLLPDGLTVIISPLISLMYDQVQQIQQRGEKRVAALNSQLSYSEKQWILSHLSDYRYIFLSPEMILQPQVLSALKKVSLTMFVIDEAHCISQWGIDFRPEYRLLGQVRLELNSPVTLALTATATPQVEADIKNILFDNHSIHTIRLSVNRPNITYQVVQTQDKDEAIEQFVLEYQGPGIIYFSSKKKAEQMAKRLQSKGIATAAYHGGLDAIERSKIQQQFLNHQLEILCATTAFGMGVNKPDIRYVIHYHMSSSLEAFVQESGRAGRDGKRALSLLFYGEGDEYLPRLLSSDVLEDFDSLAHMMKHNPDLLQKRPELMNERQQKWHQQLLQNPDKTDSMRQTIEQNQFAKEKQLSSMLDYIKTDHNRRSVILEYFGEKLTEKMEDELVPYEDFLEKRTVPSIQTDTTENYVAKIKQLFNCQ